jgi:hypothetical protein
LLSSRGISTPSLQARGEQRRFFYFNNDRDIPICWKRIPTRSGRLLPISTGGQEREYALEELTSRRYPN